MTATATMPDLMTPTDAETSREHIADALIILAKEDAEIDELDLAAVRHRLRLALEQADLERAAYDVACNLVRESERTRRGLVEQLRDCYDELATHRAVEKLLRLFIRDVDKASPIIAEYLAPLAKQMASEAQRAD